MYIRKASIYFSRLVADRERKIRSYHNNRKYSCLFHENFLNLTLLALSHCVKFHLIPWCGNFVERHSYHTRKLDKVPLVQWHLFVYLQKLYFVISRSENFF